MRLEVTLAIILDLTDLNQLAWGTLALEPSYSQRGAMLWDGG